MSGKKIDTLSSLLENPSKTRGYIAVIIWCGITEYPNIALVYSITIPVLYLAFEKLGYI